MISIFLMMVFFMALLALVGFVALAGDSRRKRLELALEPTCLLCDSRNMEAGIPPEYRCRDCGFDTHKAGSLTTELERFRELSYAVDELQVALRALTEATQANQVGRIPAAAEPYARALEHLRDVVLDEARLLRSPELRVGQETVAKLTEYVREVRHLRDDARYAILGQMSADGAVEAAAQLDFEHAIERDYEEL